MNLLDSHIIRIQSLYRFQWEAAQNAYVLLYPEGMITLNSSAGEILSRCAKGDKTVLELIQELEQQFPDAGDLRPDIYEFLRTAYEHGWIDYSPAT
ncbi:pyrroloquinoline quinone biosynthesis peptide chaperone PqqD [Thioflexithrix psekupsensis]|uniref:Pyrroloquinoline quinone biosynthesis protein PqqD n=1 Tax=Thioflexithrix psekupsensis TaxID=1570016 RepID=A0A251X433_9GAMM|nr:pyrroloquinoline quinone biosynthesis peptide chaperone PqqD [Thioflexithrix psekupsensis]OUD11694.1 pyrroloquinoline quinone biosynthesis protein PqqD [Thioflexithrix psekupsensis]